MGGINDWFVKPDREADAHPRETYDAESDRYYYDPNKKKNRFIPNISISCDITPSRTEEYAEIIRDIIRKEYPSHKVAEADVPVAVHMSVYPAHFYAGGLQPYVVGESIFEWEKWLYESLKGLVWKSEKQVCLSSTEIRHREIKGLKIRIYFICEQLQKKNNER